jgi:putative spermidine/putrescine transport system permease protein
LPRSRWFLTLIVLIYAILLGPLVAVLGVSVSPIEQFAISWAQPSLKWYVAFFQRETFYSSLFYVSLPLAVCTATVATLIGTSAAVAITRYRFPGKKFIETLLMLPLVIPSILLGAALYLFFARLDAASTILSLAIGHVLIGIPYAVRVVTAGLSGIDPAVEDAAVSLGCSRLSAFFKVVLPLIRGSLLSGWIFCLIVSFSDINVALFLSGPNTQTLPLQIFSEIRWGGDPTIAAASGIQIFVVGALVLAVQTIFKVRLAFK